MVITIKKTPVESVLVLWNTINNNVYGFTSETEIVLAKVETVQGSEDFDLSGNIHVCKH